MKAMINTANTKGTQSFYLNRKRTGRNTLIIVGVILITLGILGSFFSSQAIEKFFWEARTKSEIKTVIELYKSLEESDIARWQEADANERIGVFAGKIEQYLPSIAAMKIFAVDGTIAWTDLKKVQPGYKKPGIESELQEVTSAGQMIKSASESTKQELIKENLLEIWTVLKGTRGETLGFVELYFDSSDITAFINKIQYTIWGTTTIVLGIVITLLGLAFRKQDDLIVHQARELSNVIEKSPIGIYTITKKGVIETFNPKMVEISGVKNASVLIGKNVFEMGSYKEAGLDKLIAEGLAGNAFEKELEITSVQGGGKKTYRHYHGVPLKDTKGAVDHLLLMVEDITERKALEAKAGDYAKGLEAKIDARTKELQTRIADLEQFERVTVGRELRMTELKQEIEKMRIKLESVGVSPQ
ncbi:MAG: PAS domain-containing protein [Patescibacteria group bacterium]